MFALCFLVLGVLVKRQDDYTPIFLPMDEVFIADTVDVGNLTISNDDTSIETLFLTSGNFTLPGNNGTLPDDQVQIADIQTSEDNELNQFLLWSNCGSGMLVDYLSQSSQ